MYSFWYLTVMILPLLWKLFFNTNSTTEMMYPKVRNTDGNSMRCQNSDENRWKKLVENSSCSWYSCRALNIGLIKKFEFSITSYGKTWTNFLANPIQIKGCFSFENKSINLKTPRDFPDGPVVKNLPSKNKKESPCQCRKCRFRPSSGN